MYPVNITTVIQELQDSDIASTLYFSFGWYWWFNAVFMIVFHRECILCRAFLLGLNPSECEANCAHLNFTLVRQSGVLATVPTSPGLHRCIEVDAEGCRVHFLLRTGQKEGSDHFHVALKRGRTCLSFFLHQYISCIHQCNVSVKAETY